MYKAYSVKQTPCAIAKGSQVILLYPVYYVYYSSMYYNIPLLMVLVFLGSNLVVELYCSKRTHNLQEYAVGNKNFVTSTLVATVLAGIYSGGSLVAQRRANLPTGTVLDPSVHGV